LSVPMIAALAGVVLFDEPITVRLAVSSVLVLGGTALGVRRKLTSRGARRSQHLCGPVVTKPSRQK